MFESLRIAIQDLLHGRVAPGDRRTVMMEMKRALVSAKLGVEDLRAGVEQTRRRLGDERDQLAMVMRRKVLAEGIKDAETAALAAKYELQHGDRVAVLTRKLEAQEAEAALAERELDEMMTQVKAADAGVGSAASASFTPGSGRFRATEQELGIPDDAKLQSELERLARERARGDADATADAKLAALKKRMGKV